MREGGENWNWEGGEGVYSSEMGYLVAGGLQRGVVTQQWRWRALRVINSRAFGMASIQQSEMGKI